MDEFIRKAIRASVFTAIIISAVLIVLRRDSWALGLLAGSLWSAINLLFTSKLLKVVILQESKSKLVFILLVKYPLLYLAAFLMIIAKWFSVLSFLAGLILVLAVTGVVRIWQK